MKSEINVGHDGKSIDKGYLECDLPKFLQNFLEQMKKAWEMIDAGANGCVSEHLGCHINMLALEF